MRIPLTLFLIIVWTFLILAPLNAFAEDKIYTCKVVIGGYPTGDGKFYMEVEEQEPKPLLDGIAASKILLNDEGVFYKNNPLRGFERLTPYERIADVEIFQEIEEGMKSWDEMLALENVQTYYLPYRNSDDKKGDFSSVKRISINKKNNRTSEITIPFNDNPAYFFLRKCEGENTKEPIQADFQEGPDRKLS